MQDDTDTDTGENLVANVRRVAKSTLNSAAAGTAEAARRTRLAAVKLGATATTQSKEVLQRIDANHEKIAEHLETAAQVTRVAAGVAVAGAAVAAPTGLAAAGVAVGLLSAPVIVTAAPVLAGIALGAASVSAAADLYKKARRKRDPDSESSQETQPK